MGAGRRIEETSKSSQGGFGNEEVLAHVVTIFNEQLTDFQRAFRFLREDSVSSEANLVRRMQVTKQDLEDRSYRYGIRGIAACRSSLATCGRLFQLQGTECHVRETIVHRIHALSESLRQDEAQLESVMNPDSWQSLLNSLKSAENAIKEIRQLTSRAARREPLSERELKLVEESVDKRVEAAYPYGVQWNEKSGRIIEALYQDDPERVPADLTITRGELEHLCGLQGGYFRSLFSRNSTNGVQAPKTTGKSGRCNVYSMKELFIWLKAVGLLVEVRNKCPGKAPQKTGKAR